MAKVRREKHPANIDIGMLCFAAQKLAATTKTPKKNKRLERRKSFRFHFDSSLLKYHVVQRVRSVREEEEANDAAAVVVAIKTDPIGTTKAQVNTSCGHAHRHAHWFV